MMNKCLTSLVEKTFKYQIHYEILINLFTIYSHTCDTLSQTITKLYFNKTLKKYNINS